MVTQARSSIQHLRPTILTALILTACTATYAQNDHAYIIAIKLHVGGAPITGFLHSVTDSAVTIIPGIGGRKALETALESPRPISIPVSLIKKLSVTRVKTFAHAFFAGLGIFAGYSLAYALFIPVTTPPDFVIYVVTVTTASIFTAVLLYTRNYKPTEPAFNIKMQKYCLVPSELMMHR